MRQEKSILERLSWLREPISKEQMEKRRLLTIAEMNERFPVEDHEWEDAEQFWGTLQIQHRGLDILTDPKVPEIDPSLRGEIENAGGNYSDKSVTAGFLKSYIAFQFCAFGEPCRVPPAIGWFIYSDVLRKIFDDATPDQKLEINAQLEEINKRRKALSRRISSFLYDERVAWPLNVMRERIDELRTEGWTYEDAILEAAGNVADLFGVPASKLENWYRNPGRLPGKNRPSKTRRRSRV